MLNDALTNKRIHMIGIGGVSMSGLAAVLAERGARVSGSDLRKSPVTDRLEDRGVRIFEGHDAANLGNAEVIVATAAIPPENPELLVAREKGLPVIGRAELLGMLMEGTRGIAVAGTHGKTTTTSMVADVLIAGGVDPTVLVGGDFDRLGGNARVGGSDIFLTEACEAFSSFLQLRPTVAVVTNIEADHLEFYGSLDGVMAAFRQFLSQVEPAGCSVLCIDDPGVRELLPSLGGRLITYGLSPQAFLRADDADWKSPRPSCSVVRDGRNVGRLALNTPGRHNIQNALAALAVGHELGIPFDTMLDALAEFSGAERRFEVLAEVAGITVVDDYAHHPTEVRATMEAARTFGRRVVAVFQPHQYTRTQAFVEEFAESLSLADSIVLTEIYLAREKPIPGVSSSLIADSIERRHPGKEVTFVPEKADVAESLLPNLREGDLVIVMGAGDIRPVGEAIVSLLAEREGAP